MHFKFLFLHLRDLDCCFCVVFHIVHSAFKTTTTTTLYLFLSSSTGPILQLVLPSLQHTTFAGRWPSFHGSGLAHLTSKIAFHFTCCSGIIPQPNFFSIDLYSKSTVTCLWQNLRSLTRNAIIGKQCCLCWSINQ